MRSAADAGRLGALTYCSSNCHSCAVAEDLRFRFVRCRETRVFHRRLRCGLIRRRVRLVSGGRRGLRRAPALPRAARPRPRRGSGRLRHDRLVERGLLGGRGAAPLPAPRAQASRALRHRPLARQRLCFGLLLCGSRRRLGTRASAAGSSSAAGARPQSACPRPAPPRLPAAAMGASAASASAAARRGFRRAQWACPRPPPPRPAASAAAAAAAAPRRRESLRWRRPPRFPPPQPPPRPAPPAVSASAASASAGRPVAVTSRRGFGSPRQLGLTLLRARAERHLRFARLLSRRGGRRPPASAGTPRPRPRRRARPGACGAGALAPAQAEPAVRTAAAARVPARRPVTSAVAAGCGGSAARPTDSPGLRASAAAAGASGRFGHASAGSTAAAAGACVLDKRPPAARPQTPRTPDTIFHEPVRRRRAAGKSALASRTPASRSARISGGDAACAAITEPARARDDDLLRGTASAAAVLAAISLFTASSTAVRSMSLARVRLAATRCSPSSSSAPTLPPRPPSSSLDLGARVRARAQARRATSSAAGSGLAAGSRRARRRPRRRARARPLRSGAIVGYRQRAAPAPPTATRRIR